MKVISTPSEDTTLTVELTRRNLEALLAKLNGHPSGSACTLFKGTVAVRAVENDAHYGDRAPGPVHPDTEAKVG